MSKKKIKLIIWILVLVLVVGTILYLNRTINGDCISENLRENGVVRMTYQDLETGMDSPKIELSEAKIESLLKFLEEMKFKKIYSNTIQLNGLNKQEILVYDASGRGLAYLGINGEDYLVVRFSGGEDDSDLRIKTKGWYEEFKRIIGG